MNILDELNRYYESEDYLYEMANITGKDSGLPMSLFFSPQPQNHKIRPIRFKVSDNPNRFRPDDNMLYFIVEDDNGDVINITAETQEKLKHKDEKILLLYIAMNYQTIKQYWEMEISNKDFVNSMKHIDNIKKV